MGKLIDIVGNRYGRLQVVEFIKVENRTSYWLCKCDCGNYKTITKNSLTNGDTVSCGCYRKDLNHTFNLVHGKSNTKIYSIWSSMIQRTSNPNNDRFNCYGNRGIKVSEDWKSAENFIKWAIENGYKEGLSLERVDVNGNYSPENCTFINKINQYDNKQNSKLITFEGETRTLSYWARKFNINRETLRYRIFIAKWDLKKSFNLI